MGPYFLDTQYLGLYHDTILDDSSEQVAHVQRKQVFFNANLISLRTCASYSELHLIPVPCFVE